MTANSDFKNPIHEFAYCVSENKFFNTVTGFVWKAGGVNAWCKPIEEDGELIKPTKWLKANARVEKMPPRKVLSPLDC